MAAHKYDLLLVAALVAVGLGLGAWMLLGQRPGATVTVSVDGQVVASYPLATPRTEVIETPWGSNTLVIEGGAARVVQADCPDGVCVNTGSVCRTGESIVCLPHRLVVQVQGEGDGPDMLVR